MPPANQPQHNVLHSYEVYPTVHFESQGANETIVLLLRAHPITLIAWIFASIILLFLPIFINLYLAPIYSASQLFFINFLWYTGTFIYAFINFLHWFFNVGIITNERVVDVDFHSLIYKEVSATVITKIEDVTVKTGGFIRSVFDFGDLFIQTAANDENIEFPDIPHPTEASTIINNLMQNHES